MSQDYGSSGAATSRRWLVLIPLAWAAAILAVMSPDAIVARPEIPPALKWLIYDESDLTALALRGANAAMGRLPGRRDEPPEPDWTIPPTTLPQRLDGPPANLAERFYLEYPTPALGLFWLGVATNPNGFHPLPAAVADAHQFSVAFHRPRNDSERLIWSPLRWAVRWTVGMMTAGLIGLILVLARGPGPVWLCVLPTAVYFSLNRFDIAPTLATALAFAALARGHRGWAGVWLAVGICLKLYPVLFVPVIVRFLGPRASDRFLAGVGAGVGGGVGLAWLATDGPGVIHPILVQLSRTLDDTHWTAYGRILPAWLGHSPTGRLLGLAGAVIAVIRTRPADEASVLRRCALVLIVFTNLSVFWSPQWILWFLPLIVPLAAGRRFLTATMVGLDAVSYFTFPVLFWILWGELRPDVSSGVVEIAIVIRTLLWFTLAGLLIWDDDRAKASPGQLLRTLREHVEQFRQAGAASGLPRGLAWISAEPIGEPLFVRDPVGGQTLALVQVIVQFEPTADSELADVPQAREPRPVTAMFVAQRGGWRTTGRAIFNLSPLQVAERGRFLPLEGASARRS